MKISIIALAILLTGCSSLGDPYLKVGLGYKLPETLTLKQSIENTKKVLSAYLEA